jgi:hypothetical protein
MIGGDRRVGTQTHRQQGDLVSLLLFFKIGKVCWKQGKEEFETIGKKFPVMFAKRLSMEDTVEFSALTFELPKQMT